MQNLYARSVFFVQDAGRSLDFYTDKLGFALEWNHEEGGRPFVFQVSLFGFQLILNQTESVTEGRAGHGRVFIGLEHDQVAPFRQYLKDRDISPTVLHWGAPTLVIRDLDGNELFFWLPKSERNQLDSDPNSNSRSSLRAMRPR